MLWTFLNSIILNIDVFFPDILVRFDLEEHRGVAGIENEVYYNSKWNFDDITKLDKRIAKLWYQAESSGFSRKCLSTLENPSLINI